MLVGDYDNKSVKSNALVIVSEALFAHNPIESRYSLRFLFVSVW